MKTQNVFLIRIRKTTSLFQITRIIDRNLEKHQKELEAAVSELDDTFFAKMITQSDLEDVGKFIQHMSCIDRKKTKEILYTLSDDMWNKMLDDASFSPYHKFYENIVYALHAYKFFRKFFSYKRLETKMKELSQYHLFYRILKQVKRIDKTFKIELNLELINELYEKEYPTGFYIFLENKDQFVLEFLSLIPIDKIISKHKHAIGIMAVLLENILKINKHMEFIEKYNKELKNMFYSSVNSSKIDRPNNFITFIDFLKYNAPDKLSDFINQENLLSDKGDIQIYSKLILHLFLIKYNTLLFKHFFELDMIKKYFDYNKYNKSQNKLRFLAACLKKVLFSFTAEYERNSEFVKLLYFIIRREIIKIAKDYNPDYKLALLEDRQIMQEEDSKDHLKREIEKAPKVPDIPDELSADDIDDMSNQHKSEGRKELIDMFNKILARHKQHSSDYDKCMKTYKNTELTKQNLGDKLLMLADVLTIMYEDKTWTARNNGFILDDLREMSEFI